MAYLVLGCLSLLTYLSSTELRICFFKAVLVVLYLMYSCCCWLKFLMVSAAVKGKMVTAASVASRVAPVVDGGVGWVPGLIGGTKVSSSLAARKSVSVMTRARWPRSVVYDGTAMAFSSMAAWNFLRLEYVGFSSWVDILGMSASWVRKSAVILALGCVIVCFVSR